MNVIYPTDWRYSCPKCSRFLPSAGVGEVYAPYGDRLQYDGTALMGKCLRHGAVEVRPTPVRWVTDNPGHVEVLPEVLR